jgi:predicted MFS family arabinose efflux permease
MGVGGVVFIGLFVLRQFRAPEPIVPMYLFRKRVFTAANAAGFILGLAMFGAIIYLPVYLQVVKGVSPTISGLMLIPLMVGMLITSIGSGQIIARIGRYKVFPVVGTAVLTFGMYLFSRMGVHTSDPVDSLYMFVVGAGLGLVMQVLVLAVQNGVDYKDLGTATSLNSFFRSMGGAFGTAILGAVLTDRLDGHLLAALPAAAKPHLAQIALLVQGTPAALKKLPAPIHAAAIQAYVHSIDDVFLVATPIVALAFIFALLLPEIRLRSTVRTHAKDPDGAPDMSGTGPAAAESMLA